MLSEQSGRGAPPTPFLPALLEAILTSGSGNSRWTEDSADSRCFCRMAQRGIRSREDTSKTGGSSPHQRLPFAVRFSWLALVVGAVTQTKKVAREWCVWWSSVRIFRSRSFRRDLFLSDFFPFRLYPTSSQRTVVTVPATRGER